ncbi:MAG: hydrogenase maturation protease [Clostridiales bacterium]|nr:hydrogenase maturation protease [Clostridiales bacterium]
MSDDGLGVHVVVSLQKRVLSSQVLIFEVGTSILNYLDEISTANYVIAVDAVRAGGEAGRIYCFDDNNLKKPPGVRRDERGFTILQAVQLCRLMTGLPESLIIYGVEPLHLNFGNNLSTEINKVLPVLTGKIEKEINSLLTSL